MEIDKRVWADSPDVVIIGADEVGRGALAGPIVGCACAISLKFHNYWLQHPQIVLRDSKRMTASQRELSCEWLQNSDVLHSIVEVSAQKIDNRGIQWANHHVLKKSVENLIKQLPLHDLVIVVDNMKLDLPQKHTIISTPQAESQSLAVASASILAKTYRDQLMQKHAHTLPGYGWGQNKGYGTIQHREAIKKLGATKEHRMTFLGKIINSEE